MSATTPAVGTCWCCTEPDRVAAMTFHAGLGYECDRCAVRLTTPLTPVEQRQYAAFHARAEAQRATRVSTSDRVMPQ